MIFKIPNADEEFSRILTKTISRRGYTVYSKSKNKYGVQSLEESDQRILKNMVAQLCDHHGVEYEIID
jgi:hypothetical protein